MFLKEMTLMNEKKVFIPKEINIENLLSEEKLNRRQDYIDNLKNGMIYFLGLLHRTDQNHYKFDNNGFRNLDSRLLNNIIGKGSGNRRNINIIKDVLIKNKIIEYSNYQEKVKSYGFRLSPNFSSGDYIQYDLSKKILEKLEEVMETKKQEGFSEIKGVDYDILKEQFELNEISFDSRVYDYLRDFIQKGLKRIDKKQKNKKETCLNLFNYVGKLLNHIRQIEEKNFTHNVAQSNGRFFSSISTLPKILRPFLLINGKNVCENDIMSSQSFILSSILNKKFTHNDGIGFNLNTIFEVMVKAIRNSDCANVSKNGGRKNFITGVYFNGEEIKEIEEFHNIDFTKDFYEFVLAEGIKKHPDLMKKFPKENGRDFVKKRIMSTLFDKNGIYREENILTELIKNLYPAVNTYIERFIMMYTSNDFALLLQRAEAFLILKTCEKLKEENVPFFTIHDSIITTDESKHKVDFIMRNEIYKLSGKKVGIKSKTLIPLTEVEKMMLDEKWNKINVTTIKSMEKSKTYLNNQFVKAGVNFYYKTKKEKKVMMDFLCLPL